MKAIQMGSSRLGWFIQERQWPSDVSQAVTMISGLKQS